MIDTELIKKFATRIGYEFNQEGSKPSVIIVGEWHEPIVRCCHERLIAMLEPSCVLVETLHALCYDPDWGRVKFRSDATTGQNDLLELEVFKEGSNNFYKQIAIKYIIKLVGCDLSLNERSRLPKKLGINTFGIDPLTIDDARNLHGG